jgi:hypothetical protein
MSRRFEPLARGLCIEAGITHRPGPIDFALSSRDVIFTENSSLNLARPQP